MRRSFYSPNEESIKCNSTHSSLLSLQVIDFCDLCKPCCPAMKSYTRLLLTHWHNYAFGAIGLKKFALFSRRGLKANLLLEYRLFLLIWASSKRNRSRPHAESLDWFLSHKSYFGSTSHPTSVCVDKPKVKAHRAPFIVLSLNAPQCPTAKPRP